MAKQTINPGTAPTGAGGDTFRSGSAKLQANDDEIYNYLGDGTNLNKLGTAAFKNTGTQAGNVMEVGAFGLGGGFQLLSAAVSTPSQIPLGLDLKMATTDKLGILNNASWQGASLLSLRSYPDQSLGSTSHVEAVFYANRMFLRGGGISSGNNSFTAWAEVRSTANTTVDANGFIKNASPIIKLFADKIELNDRAKLQDITFEKLGVGDYLIKGSTGFAQEGWYVETPKDANGNVLFSVIYKTLENGDISVKTYKKKFDFETVSIVADLDNPVDITENRWIDLRLQELPQPEIEEPESVTPPNFQPTGLAQAVATVMESYHDPEQ